jgi:hypothetical protein
MLLVIITVILLVLIVGFFYGFEKSLVFLSLKRVDPVKINGNSNLTLRNDTNTKSVGSQTLIRNNLKVGDYVEHSLVTVTNNSEICGNKTRNEINGINTIPKICEVKYIGLVCEDQYDVPSNKVRVSWIGYIKGSQFVQNVGSCDKTCRNCTVSNVVDVNFLTKIDSIQHIELVDMGCPIGYSGPNNNNECTKGWVRNCGSVCARNICEGKGGRWIPKDYSRNPYTCSTIQKVPRRYRHFNNTNQCPGWKCNTVGNTCGNGSNVSYICKNQNNHNCTNPPCWVGINSF